MRLTDDEAEQFRAADAENAVGPAGDAEHVVDQGDADDLADADGDDQQVIAAQMHHRPRHRQRERAGDRAAQRQRPQNRNLVAGVENGSGVGAHRVERGVAHVEQPGLAQNQVEAEGQQGIQADAVEHIHLISVEEQRRDRQRRGEQARAQPLGTVHAHILSATRSPSSPVGRTIRIKISTQKAMASFQAMEM